MIFCCLLNICVYCLQNCDPVWRSMAWQRRFSVQSTSTGAVSIAVSCFYFKNYDISRHKCQFRAAPRDFVVVKVWSRLRVYS